MSGFSAHERAASILTRGRGGRVIRLRPGMNRWFARPHVR